MSEKLQNKISVALIVCRKPRDSRMVFYIQEIPPASDMYPVFWTPLFELNN